MGINPWEVDHSLELDRLAFMGSLIAQIWAEVDKEHKPTLGDGPWGKGCKRYDRIVNRFQLNANLLPWLRVVRRGLYLLLLVDDVPIRYYRGDFERPNKKSLKIKDIEQNQRQLSLFDNGDDEECWHWRIVAESGAKGNLERLGLVQWTSSGKNRNLWLFPDYCLDGLSDNDQSKTQPIELGKPKIGIKIGTHEVAKDASAEEEIRRKEAQSS